MADLNTIEEDKNATKANISEGVKDNMDSKAKCVENIKKEDMFKGGGSASNKDMFKGVGSVSNKDMFFRADKIDLKNLDIQLEKHLSRVWSRNLEQKPNEEWEIDLSKLDIRTVIARGTYGIVYKVKVLDWGEDSMATQAETAGLRASFQQEVAVCHKLNHLNVTKYLPGGILKHYLIRNRRKKLSFKIVIQLALDLARGLRYLHSKKIVHHDVKTENMLLDAHRNLKISDFGVARVEAQNPKDMTGETGTLGYMAPESLRPEIPRCCPSLLSNIMRKCWDGNAEKRPEMDEVVTLLEAIDTRKGSGMILEDKVNGCFCFAPVRGP
ncbi:hypothetical protein MKX01_013882 [Papaver californicum]|nr:hypothetical protein MKX01_013882 [Papaver californicum]